MIVLSTDSLKGYGLNRIFALTKAAGYEGLDLNVDFSQYDTFNIDYLRQLSLDYDLPIHAISAPANIREVKIQEIIEIGKSVKARVIILQPPKILDFKLASWLKKEIPRLREKEFISIAMENAPATTFLGLIPEHGMSNTTDLKKFKHVCLDTARIGEAKKDLMRAYNMLKKYLVHIHLSNLNHGKKYALPKTGILPLESFITKLKQDRYPGAIAIKVLPKHLHCGDDEKLIEELVEIKKYYDKYYTHVNISDNEDTDSKESTGEENKST